MKTKLLALFSLLALLLVSTSILADGRPIGLRIGRVITSGNTAGRVEIDVTVTDTDVPWDTLSSTIRLGNQWSSGYPGFTYGTVWQYASSQFTVPSPYAIDWGDGSRQRFATLFGPAGGPWVATFSHTYAPGPYTITVGDSVQGFSATQFTPGNPVYAATRYVYCGLGGGSSACSAGAYTGYNTWTTGTWGDPIVALTANTTVTPGTGIPTLNIYGLLAMAFVLVGAGLLLFRKPAVA